ncbi:3-deoxy-D-manno-octulosonic acid transferase [Seohaeicola zhoushanensis]|uniref:3-deoxy-D-manno-octulosonic acid transferase n=1 Tax=Seohaeicola zhoushanensis TaxID=1569283 RepID=A0A8J3GVS0_9RHOB|nr:glycosyltransferase N-terminal domain-containing protein [Seohaeicola zhoushanensis]GHF42630.1 3-deoxy-D-manno-octulosonic acid transferase [Seohaeicola zhoushanensis]
MVRSLSYAAYRALSRRSPQSAPQAPPARPKGELIWLHATSAARLSALNDLARRLRMMRPGIAILHTHVPSARPEDAPLPGGADWVMPLDSDHPASARQFVGHWRPDFCLWAGGILMPNVIAAAAEIGVPLCIADLGSAELQSSRHKWLPDLTRSSLDMFTWILASNQTTQRNLRRLGIAAEKITVAPRLRGNVLPPGCNDDDLESVTQDLAARQVWLAAHVRPSEFAAVLAAHRSALRLVHRLLLVISLTDRSSAETLKSALGLARLRYADWDEGDAIEDGVQVVISDDPADLGLWYRIAPLTFLASSLGEGARGVNPMEAAALGSAVLYGPNVADHAEAYARLAAAGAARTVANGDSLGSAVVQLVAPDHAATMALAGWEVATEGADLIDMLIDRIQDTLDRNRHPHETA